MSAQELKALLELVDDLQEMVLEQPTHERKDVLLSAWRSARDEANRAYADWRDCPGPSAYAVYRAAEDRADAAEAGLVTFLAPVA